MHKFSLYLPAQYENMRGVENLITGITIWAGGITSFRGVGGWFNGPLDYVEEDVVVHTWLTTDDETFREVQHDIDEMVELLHDLGEDTVLYTKEEIGVYFA